MNWNNDEVCSQLLTHQGKKEEAQRLNEEKQRQKDKKRRMEALTDEGKILRKETYNN